MFKREKKRLKDYRVDTSIKGFEAAGIKISQEHLEKLSMINIMQECGYYNDAPIMAIIMVMKAFNVLPSEFLLDVGNDNACDNSNTKINQSFNYIVGKTKE